MPVPPKRCRCKPVPSVRAVISLSKAKRARYFLRLVVGFEKMNRNSRDRVLSRRESRAFYERFERAYIHHSRPESFRWGIEPFAARFARRCAQKSPLTFCFTHSLLSLNSPLPRPQVIDVSTSKTGKHGHAKCHFVAEDIFTGKRCDELVPAGHNLEVPVVSKSEYTLLDIDDDDHMSLMDEKGETREDLKLPDDRSGDTAFALGQEVQKKFDEGLELVVTILSAMGTDQLCAWKEAAN